MDRRNITGAERLFKFKHLLAEVIRYIAHSKARVSPKFTLCLLETLSKIVSILPAPVAAVLMLGGFIFYALGCIRLGYGAAVKPLVLDLIERAEQEIQGTKRGAERKAWVTKMLRAALSASKYGRLISWAITDEAIGTVIQFFFDRAKAALEKQ